MIARQRGAALMVLVLVLAMGTVATAADLRPSWECLPPDTAIMVQLPQPARFVETLKTRTKFGSVALGPKRLEGLWQLLAGQQATEGEWSLEEFEQTLAGYGLETGEFAAVMDGDLGGGLVIRQRDGLPPLQMLLGWLEPGEELAAKLMIAVRQRLEEEADREGPAPRRIDLELAGHEVLAVVEPVMGIDLGGIEPEETDDEIDEAELRARIERLRAAKRVQTGAQHSLVTVIGSRMLFGVTLPATGKPDADDLEALADGEEARRMFATFLEAHAGDDEPPLAAVLREPALVAATLEGVPLVEIVAVPQALLSAGGVNAADVRDRLAQLGLDNAGGIAWRQSFDDGHWRSVVAATLPAPRHGLLEILDQRCDAAEVPSFVTREIADFTQISLDLGAAFGVFRRIILAEPDAEQVANMLSVADVQAQAWLGTDVATMLSGLGSRHWILSFPPQMAEAIARARVAGKNGEAVTAMADRLAIVWQIADEEPFLKLLGQLAPLAGGELEQEQGFRGLRIPGAAAAYVGRGHLVLAVGEGTLEKVLAAIRTPPTGEASLRESGVPRQAGELLALEPARLFGVSDSSLTGGTLGMLREMAAALEPDDMSDESKAWLATVKSLLPQAAEMQGMFGVGATLLRMTDNGLVYETAWEMPPP